MALARNVGSRGRPGQKPVLIRNRLSNVRGLARVGSGASTDQVPVTDLDSVPVGVLKGAEVADREG